MSIEKFLKYSFKVFCIAWIVVSLSLILGIILSIVNSLKLGFEHITILYYSLLFFIVLSVPFIFLIIPLTFCIFIISTIFYVLKFGIKQSFNQLKLFLKNNNTTKILLITVFILILIDSCIFIYMRMFL